MFPHLSPSLKHGHIYSIILFTSHPNSCLSLRCILFPHWKCVHVCVCACFKAPQWNTVWAPTCSFGDNNGHIITHHRMSTKQDCRVLCGHFVGAETEKAKRKEWNKALALLGERDGWSVFFLSPGCFSSTPSLLLDCGGGDAADRAAILVSCPAEAISRRIWVKREDIKKNLVRSRGQASHQKQWKIPGLCSLWCYLLIQHQSLEMSWKVPPFFSHLHLCLKDVMQFFQMTWLEKNRKHSAKSRYEWLFPRGHLTSNCC